MEGQANGHHRSNNLWRSEMPLHLHVRVPRFSYSPLIYISNLPTNVICSPKSCAQTLAAASSTQRHPSSPPPPSHPLTLALASSALSLLFHSPFSPSTRYHLRHPRYKLHLTEFPPSAQSLPHSTGIHVPSHSDILS